MAALEQVTRYKSKVMVGDLLYIKTSLLEVGSKTVKFLHTMYEAGTDRVISTSELVGVHLDRVIRKSCEFPEDIRSNCEVLRDS